MGIVVIIKRPMSRQMALRNVLPDGVPEMPNGYQNVHIWLTLTTLTLHWHCADLTYLFSWKHVGHRKRSDSRDTKPESQRPNTLQTSLFRSLQNIVPIRITKDAVDADILVNNGGTSILLASRNVAVCRPFMSSVIALPIIPNIWMSLQRHQHKCFTNEPWGWHESSKTNVVTFECASICRNRH